MSEESKPKAPAIGIDLGTTYSCVAVFQQGKVEIIANDQGSRITSSYVAFNDTERLIGDPAKSQAAVNPKNTIFDAKRLIGRRFDDPKIQEDMKHWPFTVVSRSGKPILQAEVNGKLKTFTPEEISSMVLAKMKETAEAFLGMKVQDAVVTVPAYFNDSQRQATKDAAQVAGLNVLRVINEPTAAALAYGLQKNLEGERNVLIYDLGGGTFDVSVLTISDGSVFKVRATGGDTHLGGEDFDSRVVAFLADKFEKTHGQVVTGNARAMRRLRTAAERAKHVLSSSTVSSIDVDSLYEGIDFCCKLTRVCFDDLCLDLFNSTLDIVENTLVDAQLDRNSIHEVVLVGGSTRIPKVQALLKSFFSGRELNLSINPDEAVAYGAAIQAAILNGDASLVIRDVLLIDVTPLSLGIEVHGGMMSKVIERNTPIPYEHMKTFTTAKDNQTEIPLKVFEGERSLSKDNNLLGEFTLHGVPPAPRGTANVDVTFNLDANSILKVSAVERSTGISANVTIRKKNLSPAVINRMLCEAERYKAEDEAQRERITALNDLESFVYKVKAAVFNAGSDVSLEDKNVVQGLCKEVLAWIEGNPLAKKEAYNNKLAKLQAQSSDIIYV